MPSRTITNDALRLPKKGERPKFEAAVPLPVQTFVWIKWLRDTAAQRRKGRPEAPTIFLSADGAEDLATLIEQLANNK